MLGATAVEMGPLDLLEQWRYPRSSSSISLAVYCSDWSYTRPSSVTARYCHLGLNSLTCGKESLTAWM